MITKLEVFSAQPNAPELSLGGFSPNLDPVQIREIDGIDPVKATIVSTELATGDGEVYQGSSVGARNIVMKLGLNPDWVDQTVSSLRRLLYRYFLPKAWCKLRFFSDDMETVDIEGYVETFQANMFSQDPEIQISVICHKPDFIAIDSTIYYGIVDDGSAQLEFEYTGTVETGFEVRVDQTVANPAYTGPFDIVMQREPELAQIFSVNPATVDGTHYLKLSTVQNKKRIQTILAADGSATNLLLYVTDESVWPAIKPGMNLFSVGALETGQAWTMAFFNRYGGL